jgi:cellulose synthase/poly-beta-1,6-N-acetylglucosamine synthase-like glycosyltransferase
MKSNSFQSYHSCSSSRFLLMPAHNEETTIATTVQSMLQLNYPEYEVIVINDGSLGRHAGRAEVRFRAGGVSRGVLGAPRSGTDS